MHYVVGDTVVQLWTILDIDSDPLTGMTSPADITFTLHRDSSGVMVAASETITFAEVGVTGHYTVSYPPANEGIYILELKELNASTFQRTYRFEDVHVLGAGAAFTPAYTNAFCAETDIERWVQTAIDANSEPTATEATGFAETRAAELMSLMAKLGHTITPATVAVGSRLEDLLRRANAIGAALDYSIAQQFAVRPSKSDRIQVLQALWIEAVGDGKKDGVTGYIENEIRGNLASLSTDHVISGDTADRPAETAPTNEPIAIGIGDLF